MDDGLDRVHRRIEAAFPAALATIQAAIRQPSVSRTGEGLQVMADLTERALQRLGAKTAQAAGQVAPIVWGRLGDDPAKPTLLFYELYDVQPAAGQAGWTVDPFAGAVKPGPDGRDRLVARGAFNSKGPLFGALAAIGAFAEAGVPLPVNLVFLVEGEEEIGSPSLPAFMAEHRTELARCDAAFIPYLGTDNRGDTVLRLGFKGLVLLEFRVDGGEWGGPAERDVHAYHGAVVASPAWQLVRALATLVDADERLAVEGLAALVPAPDDADIRLLDAAAARFDDTAAAHALGALRLKPATSKRERLARLMFDVTLNIDAVEAGRIEEGGAPATLVPRTARAFADLRVVPGVSPEAAVALIRQHLDRRGFGHVAVAVRSAYPASRSRPAEPVVQALVGSCERHAARVAVHPIHAGAAPMHLFSEVIGIPYAFGGVGHGGGAHGPDEFVVVEDLKPFMQGVATFLHLFGADPDARRC